MIWVYFVVKACFAGDQNEHRVPLDPSGASPCGRFLVKTIIDLLQTTALGAAAGGIGSAVLRIHGHVVMDPLHAARAGALGGAVLGPGEIMQLFVQWGTNQCLFSSSGRYFGERIRFFCHSQSTAL